MVYEPEAALIRRLLQMLLKGASPDEIAELFNQIPFPDDRLADDYMERFLQYMNWEKPKIDPIIDRAPFVAFPVRTRFRIFYQEGSEKVR